MTVTFDAFPAFQQGPDKLIRWETYPISSHTRLNHPAFRRPKTGQECGSFFGTAVRIFGTGSRALLACNEKGCYFTEKVFISQDGRIVYPGRR